MKLNRLVEIAKKGCCVVLKLLSRVLFLLVR
jgi:hypothetical protein